MNRYIMRAAYVMPKRYEMRTTCVIAKILQCSFTCLIQIGRVIETPRTITPITDARRLDNRFTESLTDRDFFGSRTRFASIKANGATNLLGFCCCDATPRSCNETSAFGTVEAKLQANISADSMIISADREVQEEMNPRWLGISQFVTSRPISEI